MGIGLKRDRFLFRLSFQTALFRIADFRQGLSAFPTYNFKADIFSKSGFEYIRVPIISFLIFLCSASEASCYQTASVKGDGLTVSTGTSYPNTVTLKNSDSNDGLKLIIQPAGSEAVTSTQKDAASQQGTPLEFNTTLRDDRGRSFIDPTAMVAVSDRNNTDTQHLYVILKHRGEKSDTKYAVGEITLHMNLLSDKSNAVVPGRIFRIPVHSDFKKATLGVTADDRLYVSIKGLTDHPGTPMTMVFDISAGSKNLDPVNVLMPPKQ